ncbi:hypothetical protein AYI68_g4701 [Smittium mucronatum]|uniref:Uncharacterized protein n=1 Tax=Smittium mucronatum TaxID=133383 RepID=A0A1R0GWD4_9FUNG|nr:hypothetical protein AYI68_g4701 [Smittium mucronatum]
MSLLPETPEKEDFTDANNIAWEMVAGTQSYLCFWSPSEASISINENNVLKILYALRLTEVVGRSFCEPPRPNC